MQKPASNIAPYAKQWMRSDKKLHLEKQNFKIANLLFFEPV